MRLFFIILASWFFLSANSQLLYQETFDNARYFLRSGGPLQEMHGIENCNSSDTAHGTQYDSTLIRGYRDTFPVFRGNKAVRFSIWKGQPLVGSSQRYRSEVVIVQPGGSPGPVFPSNGNVWYSFAVYFPTKGGEFDNRRCAINQWFEDGTDETTLRTSTNKFFIEVTPAVGSSTLLTYDLTRTTLGGASSVSAMNNMVKDEWHEYVFHFIHSFGSDGLIDIWRDGTLIQHITGRNMHVQLPKWKIGLYESSLDLSIINYKTVYFDNIRFADSTATLATMISTVGTNQPPTANAGNNQTITLPTSSVSVTGTDSDPDGTIASRLWTKVSGPSGGTIVSPTSATTNITGLTAGIYQFQYTVTDNGGLSANDVVQVTVNPAPNVLPTANAGPDQTKTLPTSTATMAGSGSDPDGTIVGYLWTKVSGPTGGTITTPTNQNTGITALQAGTYVFRLTVTDNSGGTGSDVMQIVVNPAPNVPPTANAGSDQTITLPTTTATLSGSGSDPDGSITGYAWTKISGPSGGNITSPTSASTGITALQAGTYVYRLTVTDNNSSTGSDLMQVVVNPAPNVPPTADAGIDQTITLPTNTATLDGSGSSDPDGTITNYLWAKVSGPTGGAITSATSVSTGITGLTQGTYVYSLLVTDNNGATASDLITITVDPAAPPPNLPPVADAGSNQAITLPTNTATLDGSGSSDPDGTITDYLWIKTSGPATGSITSPTSVSTGLTSLVQGTYIFQLTITDNNGDTGTASVQVTVLPCVRTAPTVNAGIDQSKTLPTSTATLVGTATANNCATIASTLWSKSSGPSGGNITSPSNLTTGITSLQAGTYIFKLLATDNNGDTASDVMQIVVNPAPLVPPTTNAGSDISITSPTSSTTLTGSATPVSGTTITGYAWTQISGPNTATIASPTTASTGISALVVGTYVFQLAATQSDGQVGTDAMQVVVNAAPNQPPSVDAGLLQSITIPQDSVDLSGTATDPDGSIASIVWVKVSGPSTYQLYNDSTLTPSVLNLLSGIYVFRIIATDNNGLSASDDVTVYVLPAVSAHPNTYAPYPRKYANKKDGVITPL